MLAREIKRAAFLKREELALENKNELKNLRLKRFEYKECKFKQLKELMEQKYEYWFNSLIPQIRKLPNHFEKQPMIFTFPKTFDKNQVVFKLDETDQTNYSRRCKKYKNKKIGKFEDRDKDCICAKSEDDHSKSSSSVFECESESDGPDESEYESDSGSDLDFDNEDDESEGDEDEYNIDGLESELEDELHNLKKDSKDDKNVENPIEIENEIDLDYNLNLNPEIKNESKVINQIDLDYNYNLNLNPQDADDNSLIPKTLKSTNHNVEPFIITRIKKYTECHALEQILESKGFNNDETLWSIIDGCVVVDIQI